MLFGRSPGQVLGCGDWAADLLLVFFALSLKGSLDLRLKGLLHLLAGRHLHEDFAVFHLGLESRQVEVGVAQAFAGSQVVGGLVDRIRQSKHTTQLLAHQAPGDTSSLPVGAKVLCGQPLILRSLLGKVENGKLLSAVFHAEAAVLGIIRHLAGKDPLPSGSGLIFGEKRCTGDIRWAVGVGMALATHVDILNLLRIVDIVGVGELLELLAQVLVVSHLFPLALEVPAVVRHQFLQISSDAQRILNDHLLQILDAPLQLSQPRCGALQVLGSRDVEHQEAVNVLQAHLLGDVRGKQLGMHRLGAAIAAHVEVVAGLGGDDAHILALRLRALPQTTRGRHLDLVGRSQASVSMLQGDGHGHRVLLSVAAPGAPHAALHRAQGLAVGLSCLHAGIHQLFEDVWQVVNLGAVHAQALGSGDLGPQSVLLGRRGEGQEGVWSDVTTRTAWDHRVGARLLDVGQEAVVGVLDLITALAQCVVIPQASQDGSDHRLAELTAVIARASLAHSCQDVLEGLELFDLDDVKELPARVAEVSANPGGPGLAQLLECMGQELWHLAHWGDAAATASASLASLLDGRHRVRLHVDDRLPHLALCEAHAGANHVVIR